MNAVAISSLATRIANDNASDPFDDDPIRLGETKEFGSLRVHRYVNSVKVLDTSNAGKRGKKCPELVIGNRDGSWSDMNSCASTEVNLWATRGATLAQIAARLDECYLVEVRSHRGVDITPAGSKIEIVNPWMVARFEPNEFNARDMSDPNESTIMSRDEQRRMAAKAYTWAKSNRQALENMTFREVRRALSDNGIRFHSYCGMD